MKCQSHSILSQYPNNCDIHWKLARSGFLMASDLNSGTDKPGNTSRQLMEKSESSVHTALSLNPDSGDAHKWSVTKEDLYYIELYSVYF